MASSKDQQRETDNDTIKCPLCFEQFTEPKLLDCLHTFCKECLVKLCEHTGDRRTILCPLCRHDYSLPKNGIDGIKHNFYMEMLLKEKEVLCQTCEKGNTATKRCFDCDQNLCPTCYSIHQNLKTTRSHRSADIGKEIPGSQTQTFYCPRHREEELKFFCCQCEVNICRDCKLTKHEGHKTEDIDIIAKKSKKTLESKLKKLMILNDSFLTAKENIMKALKDLDGERENLIKAIKEQTRHVVERIRTLEGELVSEVDAHFEKEKSYLDEKHSFIVQSTVSLKCQSIYIQQVLKHGILPDVTQANTSLQNFETKEVSNEQCTVNTHTVPIFVPSGIEAQTQNIGKLNFISIDLALQEIIRFYCGCPFNHMISEIFPSLDGTKSWILFQHVHKTQKQSQQIAGALYSEEGNLMSVVRGNVTQVLFIPSGEEVQFTKAPIWISDEEKKEENKVPFSRPDLRSVTVSKKGEIMILLTENRVETLSSSGETLNIVELKSVVSADRITLGGNQVYCLDRSRQSIACFTKDFDFIRSVGPPKSCLTTFDPISICCDEKGNVFVCDYQNDRVCCLIGWKFISVIRGIQRPVAVAADSENRLWVGKQNGEIVIYEIKQKL